jgi:MFS family permease
VNGPEGSHGSPVSAVALGTTGAIVAMLPVFLVGGMAVQIREELVFGSAGLGLAVGAFRGAAALTSVPLGSRVDRWGPMVSLRRSAALALAVSLGIAFTARSLPVLAAWMALGGVAVVMAQPAANSLIMRAVDVRRRATAFGIKQSAPPLSGMLAGIAVPVIALTFGWRWAFGLVAFVAFALLLFLRTGERGRVPRSIRADTPVLGDRRLLILLMFAFALADVTNNTATTFYVDSAVRAGTSPALAGTVLAIASLGAVLTRLVSGVLADRMVDGHLWFCGALLTVGAVGLALLATGRPALMAPGAVLAFCGTWGFNGVFWFAVVSAYSHAPGRVTGVIGPAGNLGSAVSPVLFGALADRSGFRTVWLLAFVTAIGAAFAMRAADAALKRRGRD